MVSFVATQISFNVSFDTYHVRLYFQTGKSCDLFLCTHKVFCVEQHVSFDVSVDTYHVRLPLPTGTPFDFFTPGMLVANRLIVLLHVRGVLPSRALPFCTLLAGGCAATLLLPGCSAVQGVAECCRVLPCALALRPPCFVPSMRFAERVIVLPLAVLCKLFAASEECNAALQPFFRMPLIAVRPCASLSYHGVHRDLASQNKFHGHCNTLQHTAAHCNTLQHTATHYSTLQQHYSTTAHCSALQRTPHLTATHMTCRSWRVGRRVIEEYRQRVSSSSVCHQGVS